MNEAAGDNGGGAGMAAAPRILERSPRLVIRASAGTGKTFQLAHRFIALLRTGSADGILTSTFTRKAAGEILSRILLLLATAALDEQQRQALADRIGDPRLTRRDCLQMLEELTRQLHRLRVSTLDSFFSKLATSFTLELGLPPGWRIMEGIELRQLRSQAVDAVLREGETRDIVQLMHLLNKGDSKRSVTQQILDTVDTFYDIFQETTPEAWRWFPEAKPLNALELAAAIAALEAVPLPSHKSIATSHARSVEAAHAGKWTEFLSSGIAAKLLEGESTFYRKPITDDVQSVYQTLIRHATAVELETLRHQQEATYNLLERFDVAFRRLRRQAGGLGFSDVTRSLAREHAGNTAARYAYRLDAHVEHLLLDEFQDTSLLQWDVLRPFADGVTKQTGRTFFCVGDIKQAIYGWRGGVAEIFEAINRQLPGLSSEQLDKSYRSSPVVIDVVNRIFEGLARHSNLGDYQDAIESWATPFPLHETAKDYSGYVTLETAPAPDDGEDGGEVVIRHAARQIAELASQAPGQTVGVLTRTNVAVQRMIAELRSLGVPASEEGGNTLDDSAAVQLLMSVLQLADHPGDTVSRFHVATSPLGPLLGLADLGDDDSAEPAALAIRRELLERGYGETLYRWAVALAPHVDSRDLRRLRQLVDLAEGCRLNDLLRPAEFLDVIRSQKVNDPTQDRVRVMTIHQAKGLQFDIVVLPELDKGFYSRSSEKYVAGAPDPTAPSDRVCLYRSREMRTLLPEEIQRAFCQSEVSAVHESLCVFYVALTRAVRAMHLIIASPRENEKSLPKTFAGLLRGALTDGAKPKPESILFTHGDPHWYVMREQPSAGRTPADPAPGRPAKPVDVEPVRIALAPMPEGRLRGRGRAAPSRNAAPRTVRLASILQPANAVGRERGTLIHAWFEQVRWLDDALPDRALLHRIAREEDIQNLDVERCLAEFEEMVRSPEIARTLSQSSYQPPRDLPFPDHVQRELVAGPLALQLMSERRFAVPDEGAVLTGVIDRLVLMTRDGRPLAADVIDFKTDGLDVSDPDAIARRVEHYRPQLRSYVRAICRVYGLSEERVAARLVMLGTGRVEVVR